MLRIIFLLAVLFGAYAAHAGGVVPSVNVDMGCTASGQVMQYDGTNLTCNAPTRPTATVGAGGTQLPTCNTAARGRMFIVTDALLPTALATVAGGGFVVIGVTCNGTNWVVQ